jgi:hypothetical protein
MLNAIRVGFKMVEEFLAHRITLHLSCCPPLSAKSWAQCACMPCVLAAVRMDQKLTCSAYRARSSIPNNHSKRYRGGGGLASHNNYNYAPILLIGSSTSKFLAIACTSGMLCISLKPILPPSCRISCEEYKGLRESSTPGRRAPPVAITIIMRCGSEVLTSSAPGWQRDGSEQQ